MRILFLIHRYPPARGGSERFIQEMASRLAAEGHRPIVYTSNVLDIEGFWRRGIEGVAPGAQTEAGVEVHRFPARVLPLHGVVSRILGAVPWAPVGLTLVPPGLVLPDLWRALRTPGQVDVVYAGAYPSLMYLGAVAARRSAAKLILMPCMHPGLEGQATQQRYFLSRRLIRLYREAGAMIALTESERQILAVAGVPAGRIIVSGAGITPGEAGGANARRFRRAYGLSEDQPVVTFIGHKTEGKGALHLLEACRVLLNERPGLVSAFVGATTPEFDQRYQALPAAVRSRVLDLALAEAEKHDLLAASSLLALPSRDDSFGIVLLEAWLHGKPVIGAKAGGIPDVIEEQQTGLLVPYGSVAGLAQAIRWLLDHPQEAARMGARGRQRTLDRWTWDTVYRRVRSAFEGGPGI